MAVIEFSERYKSRLQDAPVGVSDDIYKWVIMAHMLWPDPEDIARRDASISALLKAQTTVFTRRFEKTPAKVLSPNPFSETQPDLTKCFDHPWFPNLMPEGSKPPSVYMTVAILAYFWIGLTSAARTNSSINNSRSRAAAITGLHSCKRNGESLVLANGKDIMKTWPELKQSAHFWVAYLLLKRNGYRSDPVFNSLERFLGLSAYVAEQLKSVETEQVDFWQPNESERIEATPIDIVLDARVLNLPKHENDTDNGPHFRKARTQTAST